MSHFFILFSAFRFIEVKIGFAGDKIPALVDKAGEPKGKMIISAVTSYFPTEVSGSTLPLIPY